MSRYVISKDKKTDDYYCHRDDCPHIPVFGSIGDKAKAIAYRNMMNGKPFNKKLVNGGR